MKRLVAFGLVTLVLIPASGCSTSDALMKELFAHVSAYAETVEKKESTDRQEAALRRVENTIDKIEKKFSSEDKQRMKAKYESDLKRAKDRLDAAWKNLALEGGTVPPNPLDGFLK